MPIVSESTTLNSERLATMRHSAAHVLAQALERLYPGVELAIGPDVDNGFYYDVLLPEPLQLEDLKTIDKEMHKIVKEKQEFRSYTMPIAAAVERLRADSQRFKFEMAQDLAASGESEISFYQNINRKGDVVFEDMCSGPHVDRTDQIGSFKLSTIAGAYWRGDSSREQLQRIYGLLFATKEELIKYEQMIEEAKRRDHRRLGQDLDLFSLQEEAGGGLVFWHPRGMRIRRKIEQFWYEMHERAGYEFLSTPHIANLELWRTSGHADFYADSMYQPMSEEHIEFQLKPMNCPFHVLIYRDRRRSYRELPLRWAEMGTVYRREMSGALHGLMRVRGFTQDDAHIFCRPDQLEEEICRLLEIIMQVLTAFGFSQFEINLSTRPEKAVGEDAVWELATSALRNSLETMSLGYSVDEGGGAFYGPKIDIKIEDAIGRKWQCSTIQADFNLPERFGLSYIDSSGEQKRPIMIHRALFGSVERFFGILTEHYAGAFPLWLAPEHVRLLPVAPKHEEYAEQLKNKLIVLGVRASVDPAEETLGRRIRLAETMRVPYMVVLGDREIEEQLVNARSYFTKEQEELKFEQFSAMVIDQIKNRHISFVTNKKHK